MPSDDFSSGEDMNNDFSNDAGGNDDKPFDDEPFDAGVEADENSDPKKYIQQLAGKLGQTLRNYTETQGGADLELEKFAINSVVSATHTADMDPNDKKDIIKKINSSGQNAGGENDDFGDDIAVPDDNADNPDTPSDNDSEADAFSEGIVVYPKDRKQVFKDAKLGVNESNNFETEEKNSTFAKNEEMTETVEPLVQPKTVPVVKPNEQPKRREKPWKITPQESPQPKLNN